MSNECSRRSIFVAVVALILLAAVLRLWNLELRPPHHDEGVNGWFTERVLRDGYYVYDPRNYHGPLYFYLLAAARRVFGFGLWQLRLPGALVGTAACFIPLLLRRRLGWPVALVSCAILATSPTLVYYARYAIHETLLAAIGLLAAACILRWSDGGRARWLVGAAACVAAMVATKETTALFLAVAGTWLVGESIVESVRAHSPTVLGHRCTWSWRMPIIAAIVLAIAATIHVIAFTGAFHARGSIADQLHRSIEAYFVWGETGTNAGGHVKAAGYYLRLGLRYELVLYALAAIGAVVGVRERAIRACALVGFGMLGVYSAIPYKMPWLPMSWLVLLAIPAGHGAIQLAAIVRDVITRRLPAAVAISMLLVPALAITYRSSFDHPADRREELAYVHTDADYNRWFPYVRMAASAIGERDVLIAVDDKVTWPLPWALSPYPRKRWSARGDEHVIIAAKSRAAKIEKRLTAPYLRAGYRFRDNAEPVVVYLREATFIPLLDATTRASMSRVGVATRPIVAHQ